MFRSTMCGLREDLNTLYAFGPSGQAFKFSPAACGRGKLKLQPPSQATGLIVVILYVSNFSGQVGFGKTEPFVETSGPNRA